jgi:hypothetical protein
VPRKDYATLRLSPDLKNEIKQISADEVRSFSQSLNFLARRGIEQYRRDGFIREPEPDESARSLRGTDDLAQQMADMVAEKLLEKLNQMQAELSRKHEEILKSLRENAA